MKSPRSIFLFNSRAIFFWISFLLCACGSDESPRGDFDVLISNARIVDGSGRKEYSGDILIRGDSIASIGKIDESKITVRQKIEASGRIVSPGFIDPHAHGDPLANGDFNNFIGMGVTTICLGQDGFSFPAQSLATVMRQVDSTGIGVNLLTLIGHSTLRELSGVGFSPIPTAAQMAAMVEVLQQGMAEGAFGMSTGLEYVPGYYAEEAEMNALAETVGENGGLIMSHMRNEDDDQIVKSINELLKQGAYAPVHISHFKVVFGKGPERASQLLSMLDSARRTGIKVTADVYPYTASYTGIGILFPDWAKPPNDYKKIKQTRRADLENFLREKVNKRNGPEATVFGDGAWKGMTLAQVADSLKLSFEDVLIDAVGPEGGSGAYFVMNEGLQSVLLQDSLVCVSSDGSPTMHHPRGYGAFAKIIHHYVNETQSLDIVEAIRKMTSLPASILGLQKRGLIRTGYKADLLIFNPNQVEDRATYEMPHQLAHGFDYVLVNGKIAKKSDELSRERYGRFLRKNY